MFQLNLSLMGYQVDAASSADEALRLAKTNRHDVIVSDLRMPDIDGVELIGRMRRLSTLASIPAIALTGLSLDEEVQRALASGFTNHLTKPVDASQLARLIDQLTDVRIQRKAV
jgi:CheY-like chemotaxis protein